MWKDSILCRSYPKTTVETAAHSMIWILGEKGCKAVLLVDCNLMSWMKSTGNIVLWNPNQILYFRTTNRKRKQNSLVKVCEGCSKLGKDRTRSKYKAKLYFLNGLDAIPIQLTLMLLSLVAYYRIAVWGRVYKTKRDYFQEKKILLHSAVLPCNGLWTSCLWELH